MGKSDIIDLAVHLLSLSILLHFDDKQLRVLALLIDGDLFRDLVLPLLTNKVFSLQLFTHISVGEFPKLLLLSLTPPTLFSL